MVEEHELQKEKIQEDYNDKYWDQRYTIVQQQIPSFLQKMADKILSTGRCFCSERSLETGITMLCVNRKEMSPCLATLWGCPAELRAIEEPDFKKTPNPVNKTTQEPSSKGSCLSHCCFVGRFSSWMKLGS